MHPQSMTNDMPPAAFDVASLASTYNSRLRQFIMKRIRNPADAEDIMQSTYLEAIRFSDKFRSESRPETWLFGIALNLVRHHVTRSAYRATKLEYREMDDSDQNLDFVTIDGDPSDLAERRITLERIQEAAEYLPVELQEVLRLIVIEDCTYEEAAAQMGVPVGTIRSRLFRARSMLREYL